MMSASRFARLRSRLPGLFVALNLAAFASPAFAGLQILGNPSVSFDATGHPGMLDLTGKTNQMTLEDQGDKLVFHVNMNTVSTGIDLRDEHMRSKYVQTDKYPEVVLTVPKSSITFPTEKGQSAKGTVDAIFTAHGMDEPVKVNWRIKRTKTGWSVKGDFEFDTSKHGIEIPSFLGVTVDPQMRAHAKFNLVEDGQDG